MAKSINVVGAVILKEDLVLCAQRSDSGTLPGLWEFPGGKIELNESMQEALRREIQEELACEIAVKSEIASTIHQYDFGVVTLTTFYCDLVCGTPTASEHASIIWLTPEALFTLEWAPADIPAVSQIQKDLG